MRNGGVKEREGRWIKEEEGRWNEEERGKMK